MQKDNPLFEDFARLASGAMGSLHDIRREVESQVESRVSALLRRMEVVPREEFEVVREMAAKAREQQELLTARVAALEQQLQKVAGKKKP